MSGLWRILEKAFVRRLGLADHTSDVLAFGKNGRLIFRRDGELTVDDTATLIRVIGEHLGP